MPTKERIPAGVDAIWFKDRLRDQDLSQRKLAKLLGTDPSAVSLMLSGKRRITLEEATGLSRLLGLPLDEVMTHAGIEIGQPVKSVPLIGEIDADGEIHAVKAGKRVPVSQDILPANTVAAVCTDQEAPNFGWSYFYEPRAAVDADCVGRLCAVELPSGQRYLRFLKPAAERGKYNLLTPVFSVNIANAKVKTASPVLWIKT